MPPTGLRNSKNPSLPNEIFLIVSIDFMKKIKFSTKTKDGIIIIPKKYQRKITNPIEVTLQYNDINMTTRTGKIKNRQDIDAFFNNFQIDLSHYKFDRDEANQR